MHFEFEFDDDELRKALKRVAMLKHNAHIMRKVAGVLQQEAESAFDNETSPSGEQWETLNSNYKQRRYTAGYTGNILQVTGNLVKSLSIDYADNIAIVGVSEAYGQYHQFGTKNMPARPFLGLSDDGIEEIKAILNRELSKTVQS
ncbi:phage virion morphogenesis protein [Actinobacillus pleuropneumoniae]|uniref:phage virion morphogenesis protein n=1 Tax=Actinobacillus pleuropneumoniae TaxID=715 RepID=UPI003B022170